MSQTPHPPRILHPLLDLPNIQHGFFTRLGGVSASPYDSLNIGLGSGDEPAAVLENRRRIAESFGRKDTHLLTCYQIHSAKALTVNVAFARDARPEADGLISGKPGLVLGALSADCAPLLFADPFNRVVAAAHAGWRGALSGIIEATLDAMTEQGADLKHIRCVIGPCIQQTSYEVGADFEENFAITDSASPAFFREGQTPDKRFFDLPGYCLMRLRRKGLSLIASTGHDTCTDQALFFSNRRAFKTGEPDYGRLISAIMLRPE